MGLVWNKIEKSFQPLWPFSQPEAFKSRSKNRIGMKFQEACPELCSPRKLGAPTQSLGQTSRNPKRQFCSGKDNYSCQHVHPDKILIYRTDSDKHDRQCPYKERYERRGTVRL